MTDTVQTTDQFNPIDFPIQSSSLDKFAEAFSKLQSEILPVKKTKTGKISGVSKSGKAYDYSYKYADLEDIIASYRPLLAKHGFMVTQHKRPVALDLWLITKITHKSNQWIASYYPLEGPSKIGQQQHGSETTYARRYEVSDLFHIVAEDDDDGSAATAGHRELERTPPATKSPPLNPMMQTKTPPAQIHKGN